MRIDRYAALLLLPLLMAAGCDSDLPESPDTEGDAPLVVEGWIEEGGSPIVIVTRAVDLTQENPSFDGFVEKWCRVSIFDGDTRYLLTARSNDSYTPSFIYTSARLKGKAGHTYRLMVETESDTITAESTILPTARILRLEPTPSEESDTLYSICARLRDVEQDAYYKIFAKSSKEERRFYGSFAGTFRGSEYDSIAGRNVTRGLHGGYDRDDFSHYYAKGDRVTVKICSMEREIYEFWKVYDSNVSFSGNLFFTYTSSLPSNLQGGALGYWAAYGMREGAVIIPR